MSFEIKNGVLIIPDGVTSIGDEAFSYCESLKSVTIPDSVTSIGDLAFLHCTNLTSVTIPDSVTSIGKCAFLECESLESVTIPDSVTNIIWEDFLYCSSLESITFQSTKLKELKIETNFYCEGEDYFECSFGKYYEKVDYDFGEVFMRLHYLSCDDKKEEAKKYLLEKYSVNESELAVKLLKEIIDNENVAFIHHISKTGDFLTKGNIDELIEYARDEEKLEISVILMNYKNEHFGFDDPLADFKL
ncbi:MAG: leucine-rich repeat domain-containing protein [Ruminococcus sp.]|nr:leucine-rich repeat domain-containing protein [Ruminococcus sp.]